MSAFLYASTVPQFLNMLDALSGMLDRAERHAERQKFDVEVLLNARLAPDMFHTIRQVQLVCGFAILAVQNLSGEPSKPLPRTETNLAEVRALIAKTKEIVSSYAETRFEGGEERLITFPTGPNTTETWTGRDFLLRFVTPNFYFHLSTAYAILRHNGVRLRKRDYTTFLPR